MLPANFPDMVTAFLWWAEWVGSGAPVESWMHRWLRWALEVPVWRP